LVNTPGVHGVARALLYGRRASLGLAAYNRFFSATIAMIFSLPAALPGGLLRGMVG